ncbi:MAG: hypothetical protein DRP66_04450 [Planctomycetota bacterium]|nr:MAG: hypothetical protein DRP66_04450 [Planctomycetota bacterium]
MTREAKEIQESSPKVPAYIVTFSDMVTLLLTFFVMLLSLASVQDPELFNVSRDAFVKHINSFGLGMLMGKKVASDFGHVKDTYYIDDPDEVFSVRTIDANEENIRRLFKKVAESMKTMPSQIVAQRTAFSVTGISFPPGQARLNARAEKYLTEFAMNLQQDRASAGVKLYVLGLAEDEPTEKERYMLSAKRARAVADFLKSILPSQLRCPVYSWGAGSGGCWVARGSLGYKESQILIAVLRRND